MRPNPISGFRRFVRRQPAITEAVNEITSGGIIFRKNPDGKIEFLLIQDAKGRWTIPKGHVEAGEHPGAAAEREIREETGLQDMEVFSELGKVTFRYRRVQTLVLMTMHIWLVEARGESNKLDPEEWLMSAKWLPANDAIDKIEYEDIAKLMLLGLKKIREGTV
jgi:ADP-ribose pyrophosphatase YjhB (NUDIX family)